MDKLVPELFDDIGIMENVVLPALCFTTCDGAGLGCFVGLVNFVLGLGVVLLGSGGCGNLDSFVVCNFFGFSVVFNTAVTGWGLS